jgi:hypothetical protein
MRLPKRLPSRLSVLILAMAAAMPLAVGSSAYAQSPQPIAANSFEVRSVRALKPGTELAFNLTATPRAEVVLQIAGATGDVRMYEAQPGVYEGT